jgi:hypothetical protein
MDVCLTSSSYFEVTSQLWFQSQMYFLKISRTQHIIEDKTGNMLRPFKPSSGLKHNGDVSPKNNSSSNKLDM